MRLGAPTRVQAHRRTASVAELAFAYGRAVLEVPDVSEETKTRALAFVSTQIVPLAGALDVADLTPAVRSGVAAILADVDEGRWVVYVWNDLLRWGDAFLARERCRGFGG